MKEELAAKMHEYLSRENAYITQEDARLLEEARAYDADARALATRADEMRQKRGGAVDGASEVEVNALEANFRTRGRNPLDLNANSAVPRVPWRPIP